jgi:uncharacterized protein
MTLFYRILFFLIGLLILSFGISLTIKSGLGSGAWDALNVGLSETIGFTPGTWVVLVGILLIILNSFLLKSRPDFGAIITLLLTGVFIDFWLLQIFEQFVLNEIYLKLLVLIGGVLSIGVGISIYIQARLPLSPIDNLMMAIQARFGVNLMKAKTIGELTALILAFFFSGPIGVGTLMVTFSVGPLIQLFSPTFEQLLNRIVVQIR